VADRKISDLTALLTPATGDLLPIVDISEAAAADKNKSITVGELLRGAPDGTAAAPGIAFESDGGNGMFLGGTDILAFSTGGTQAVTIDASQRVGLGTSSPGNLLHVESTFSGTLAKIKNNAGSTSADIALEIESSTTAAKTFLVKNSGTDRFWVQGNGTAYFNGSVGIGTTSPSGTLDVETASDTYFNISTTSGTSGAGIGILSNANEGFIGYQNALRFATVTGKNAAGFNERARIDNSGRLLVGLSTTSNNDTRAIIQGIPSASTAYGALFLAKGDSSPADGAALGIVEFSDSNHNSAARILAARDGGTWNTSTSLPSRLMFSTTADGASSPTERMRINSDGFLQATATGSYASTIGYNFAWDTVSRFLINHTSTTAGNNFGVQITYAATPNNTSNEFLYCNDATATRFIVRSNGGLANYQSNDINLCDEREKKNIETLDSTWGCLKNWELKKFHYNEDADTDDKRYGVIAQQVAPHCPEVITDWIKQKAEDAVLDDDGNVVTPAVEEVTRMGVKEQQMMWMAIKALQEAQLRIETLEAEVAALKGA